MPLEILFAYVLGIFTAIGIINCIQFLQNKPQGAIEAIKTSLRPKVPPTPLTKLKAKPMGDQHEGRIARLAEEDE